MELWFNEKASMFGLCAKTSLKVYARVSISRYLKCLVHHAASYLVTVRIALACPGHDHSFIGLPGELYTAFLIMIIIDMLPPPTYDWCFTSI